MVRVASKKSRSLYRRPVSAVTAHWGVVACALLLTTLFGFYIFQHNSEEISAGGSLRSTSRNMASAAVKSSGGSIMVAAHSATRIVASGKPYLIYGTAWKKDQTARLVSEAIRSGFRFVDTACQPKHYKEPLVGDGWVDAAKDLGLTREDLWIQTKFTSVSGQDPNEIPYDKAAPLDEQVKQSLQISLKNLHVTYLDSLVMHSPMRTLEDTMVVWRVFESFVDDGLVRQLGISNCYDINVFRHVYEQARIKPKVLQNRFYSDSHFDVDLRNFCKEHGILYQSFWTLTANRQALATPEVRDMAEGKGLTPQTLMYAYMMSMGHTPLDGTTNRRHMAEDVAVMERMQGGEVILSPEEIQWMSQHLGVPASES